MPARRHSPQREPVGQAAKHRVAQEYLGCDIRVSDR
jgi:hypothetical protein